MILGRRIRSLLNRLIPCRIQTGDEIVSILNKRYGYWQSVEREEAINKEGQPIPWYTYPALEYLDQLDFKEKVVFEWGSGNSSHYWARVARVVTCVEDDPSWFRKIAQNKNENLTINLIEDKREYVNAITQAHGKYDLIVIDGAHRYECALVAPEYLAEGGLIILDNSDWQPEAAKSLREAGLLQVDMSGFGPATNYTWTTTLFFHRNFNMTSATAVQPRPSLGAVSAPQNPRYGLR